MKKFILINSISFISAATVQAIVNKEKAEEGDEIVIIASKDEFYYPTKEEEIPSLSDLVQETQIPNWKPIKQTARERANSDEPFYAKFLNNKKRKKKGLRF